MNYIRIKETALNHASALIKLLLLQTTLSLLLTLFPPCEASNQRVRYKLLICAVGRYHLYRLEPHFNTDQMFLLEPEQCEVVHLTVICNDMGNCLALQSYLNFNYFANGESNSRYPRIIRRVNLMFRIKQDSN